ncbi:TetR family transcriptional regulator [Streptomyces sp. B1866]|uniref:TetR family transcriptional regulator n=1 Tax=Streptomyces sp. B1866 TaxID=3075431 RepID=UPI00288CBB5C|nr:TetR family transcriptional regulator [Streptomyces sp. B1866]MDT3399591.1 TetR family transcriptional regulator [Streptomyces sp. B1866]
MTADQAASARAGLRERRKQRTRGALVRAALARFTRQGYEQTTVEEIAGAAEVSQRTFFRYFASKEEVAFATQEAAEAHFFARLRERPPCEPPLTALRRAALGAWDTIGDAIGELVPVELHVRAYRMIESTPVLLAAHLRRTAELQERTAREIARREGLDVDADPRPRLVVAVFGGATRVAGKLWGECGDCTAESLRELTAFYLDHLGAGLAEPWAAGPAGRVPPPLRGGRAPVSTPGQT